jgi:hypothetical protein
MKKVLLALVIGVFITTGSFNTISQKMVDEQNIPAFENGRWTSITFSHPIFQAAAMFYGEYLCLLVSKLLSLRQSKSLPCNPLLFLLPALCDVIATPVMCKRTLHRLADVLSVCGLFLTYPSIYQMLRGSLIVFTGLLSWIFLKRRYHCTLSVSQRAGCIASIGSE